MWVLIATFLGGVLRNWRTWLVIAGLVLISTLLAYVRRTGKQSAELERLQEWSKYQAQRAKDRAAIQSMRNSDARDQLRKRWSQGS